MEQQLEAAHEQLAEVSGLLSWQRMCGGVGCWNQLNHLSATMFIQTGCGPLPWHLQMEAARAARASAETALDACRSELAAAAAKAATAADDAAKWQGAAAALEGQLAQAEAAAEAASRDAGEARDELAAKDERIAEMRCAFLYCAEWLH